MLLFVSSAFAQEPYPHPDYFFPTPVNSPDGMNGTCVALIYLDGIRVETEATLEVAFFDELGNCRQRAFVHNWGSTYGYQFQSVMYGANGQTLTFKFYDHTAQKSSDELGYVCITSFIYAPNYEFGTLTNPQHVYFYTPATCTFTNVSDNNWSTATNWSPRIPVSCDNAVINGACLVEAGTTPTYASLTIKDGAQFYDLNGRAHTATVEKNITGYTGTKDNYYFVSSPIGNPFNYASAGMLSGDFDLYFFQINGVDENEQRKEWQNYEFYAQVGAEEFFVAPLHGYLYASSNNRVLQFTGELNMSGSTTHTLKDASTYYCAGEEFAGFNLIGNDFPCNASVTGNTKVLGYYMMNAQNGRSNVIAVTNPVVAPCTALFAVISQPNNFAPATITFTPGFEEANVRNSNNNINIEINNAEGNLIDRAYIEISENEGLKKFNLNQDASQIYFRQDGQNYAIVRTTEASQLPFYFETKEYGEYTINVKMENMNCEYLHLIDNMTGADVDLNVTPSYTFNAHQGDYTSRFRLVFEGTGVEENNTESFVIVEGNRFIIPEAQNGSTLTIIDMMGRVVSSQTISGSFDQVMNLANGIYIVKLNGNSQKVIVR